MGPGRAREPAAGRANQAPSGASAATASCGVCPGDRGVPWGPGCAQGALGSAWSLLALGPSWLGKVAPWSPPRQEHPLRRSGRILQLETPGRGSTASTTQEKSWWEGGSSSRGRAGPPLAARGLQSLRVRGAAAVGNGGSAVLQPGAGLGERLPPRPGKADGLRPTAHRQPSPILLGHRVNKGNTTEANSITAQGAAGHLPPLLSGKAPRLLPVFPLPPLVLLPLGTSSARYLFFSQPPRISPGFHQCQPEPFPPRRDSHWPGQMFADVVAGGSEAPAALHSSCCESLCRGVIFTRKSSCGQSCSGSCPALGVSSTKTHCSTTK